ncbi:ergothioneine biosynthesis protein EgtB [Hirschia baltica]|uniref:Ergothioneine biosynthesis protein EgtB n=1 Tax=Hirschia baltica (strain ATCC 49814 / DSM 5838 / IFAM 1418) TaxID=582402 RepID=C6XQZ8_HIRBI|nr:ergothioneine biosynthesis protein EgtB [Hirschia baltica]ACT60529.1 protein of unknown function DUF323 [Hirschia baltica ATCC 49814]
MFTNTHPQNTSKDATLAKKFTAVRERTVSMCKTLSDADATAQSMPDASPAKWHLAHTSWFFEEFIIAPELGESARFNPAYAYLFNSYYDAVGPRHLRNKRGLLTRPSLEEIYAYRNHVNTHMHALIQQGKVPLDILELGLAHEEQHQELFYTDILHLFAQNPLKPAFTEFPAQPDSSAATTPPLSWTQFEPATPQIGHSGDGFAFDCETPLHPALTPAFKLANRNVTNAEWIDFIEAGGYANSKYWLSDGFATKTQNEWHAPLYWEKKDNAWWTMTLGGFAPVELDAPVCHISFYEADAYACWAGARLPTEAEWEHAAKQTGATIPSSSPPLKPLAQTGDTLTGMFENVWEWTASAFLPYPGFQINDGAIGEYNGKFMSGQMVLRGGSCGTSPAHTRSTYRNFFHPDKRWQFSGLRLAKDIT